MSTTMTTPPTTTPAPDFAAITSRQRGVWASGDYHAIAARIPLISELLCDAADIRAGSRVLDVAGGSGNTALAAARCGAEVTSLDYVPALLDRARERAAAEGLAVTTVEGDAQALPFPDASFDAVISVVGVMFAPDHRRTAAELLRVCRPGGTVAVANWTPEGFIGGLLRTVGRHVPPPAGVVPGVRWGVEEHVRNLFGDAVTDVWSRHREYTFRFESPAHMADFFLVNYGPTLAAWTSLDESGRAALRSDIEDLAREGDRIGGGGAVAIPAEYLELVATRC